MFMEGGSSARSVKKKSFLTLEYLQDGIVSHSQY